MKEEENGKECPNVVAGQRPAAVEEVEQEMAVNFPGGHPFFPSI
jgi:hypothetical protein